jgi:atlastin
MEGEAIQILKIEKNVENSKSNYKLDSKALSAILSDISDKKVAIISIVGKSRRGKSFLINYLIKYLSNASRANWFVKRDEPLIGMNN